MNTSEGNRKIDHDDPTAVIILNWNRSQDTLDAVSTILAQTHRNFHLYVCDNGSAPSELELLNSQLPDDSRISRMFFETNLGFTTAHIKAFESLSKKDFTWLALLNNDAFAEKNWLENLLKCAHETGAAMVTSKMVSYYDPQKIDNAGHFMLNTGEIMPLGHGEPVEKYKTRLENTGPCAGAALYSMEMLEITGFFDPYFITGYEDAELGIRAIGCGYKSVFEPDAIVRHKMGASLKPVINYRYLLRIQTNIFYSWFKIMPAAVILINIPCMFIKLISMLIIDILFIRWRFLKILFHSHFLFLFHEWGKTCTARKQFRSLPVKRIPWYRWMGKQRFFLFFDAYRFYRYILLNKPTQYEKYRK